MEVIVRLALTRVLSDALQERSNRCYGKLPYGGSYEYRPHFRRCARAGTRLREPPNYNPHLYELGEGFCFLSFTIVNH